MFSDLEISNPNVIVDRNYLIMRDAIKFLCTFSRSHLSDLKNFEKVGE
jgi:hypothetical protein